MPRSEMVSPALGPAKRAWPALGPAKGLTPAVLKKGTQNKAQQTCPSAKILDQLGLGLVWKSSSLI